MSNFLRGADGGKGKCLSLWRKSRKLFSLFSLGNTFGHFPVEEEEEEDEKNASCPRSLSADRDGWTMDLPIIMIDSTALLTGLKGRV